MKKFRDGAFGSPIILFAICFVITLALAATYSVTHPIIVAAEEEAANKTRMQVLPQANGFSKIQEEFPAGVVEAYAANNGVGYVITSQASGFDGKVTYIIALDKDGLVVGIDMFSHTETPNIGTRVGEKSYLEQYYGDVNVDAVDAVSGATLTSNSLKNALKQALAAYEQIQ